MRLLKALPFLFHINKMREDWSLMLLSKKKQSYQNKVFLHYIQIIIKKGLKSGRTIEKINKRGIAVVYSQSVQSK